MQALESLKFPDTSELVSIIMPVHNGEKFIREAVESVFSQSYTNWHLIIVNDMSTDKTRYILEEFTSSSFKNRIEIIENKENLGVALSRNRAISQASGDWIAFLDADDVWHPNKLREQLHLARLNSSLVVFSPYYVMNEEGVVNGIVQNKPIVELKDMLHFNPIGNLTGMYKSSMLGKFLQKKIKHEDYIMWFEVINKAVRAYSTPNPLAFYRKTHRSVSASKTKAIGWQWNIYREVFQYDFFSSLLSLMIYAGHNLTKVKSLKQSLHYKCYCTKGLVEI